jgi:nitroreductase
MEFKQTVEQRASVRNFTDEVVPEEKIKEMIKYAGMAPCVGGKETWRFIAVMNKDIINKMSTAVKNKYDEILPKNDERITENVNRTVEMFSSVFTKAPVVIAVLSEPYTAIIDMAIENTSFTHEQINKLRNYPDIQTIGAAIQNLLLAAVDLGYGACWLTGPMVAKEELCNLLVVKEPYSLMAFVALGKPDKQPLPRIKTPVEDILKFIK